MPKEELPFSFFAVHCEPTTANDHMFEILSNLVQLADRYSVRLTVEFTAQWAEMILANEMKINMLRTWQGNGHEIGCHHHPYWTTRGKPASWDGYTNTRPEDLDPEDPRIQNYLGSMQKYMDVLNRLPGQRKTGCLGIYQADERDKKDWPSELPYMTDGHWVDDAISRPKPIILNNCTVHFVGHSLLSRETTLERLKMKYSVAERGDVFGVVIHVFNFARTPELVRGWFSFLKEKDPEGDCEKTVSEIIEEILPRG